MIEFDKVSCHCELVRIQREANFWAPVAFVLTARRYNLVGVTRRQHRHKSVPIGQKAVTVQGGYGVVFAIRVQVLIEDTRVAVQS